MRLDARFDAQTTGHPLSRSEYAEALAWTRELDRRAEGYRHLPVLSVPTTAPRVLGPWPTPEFRPEWYRGQEATDAR